MKPRELMAGNEALARAALDAGCEAFFGYPITPATEILEYMAVHLPRAGGVFLQAESELAAISMAFGAASAGKRVLVASSSPGISLMQEAFSTLAAASLPCVVVNVMRGGPGLGNIDPSQADYFQATKGGGHGDYHAIVLAPGSVRETVNLTVLAFDLADRYRILVIMLVDGVLGHMMEPVDWPDITPCVIEKKWAVTGADGRPRNLVLTAPLFTELQALNRDLSRKYAEISQIEPRWESLLTEDATLVVVAFGTAAQVSAEAVLEARGQGMRVGLLRPITLWPFPAQAIAGLPAAKSILTVEMSAGQMVEDVRLAVNGRMPVEFYGAGGGWMPDAEGVGEAIRLQYEGLMR